MGGDSCTSCTRPTTVNQENCLPEQAAAWLIIKREYFLGYILKINPFAADMSKLFVYGVNAQCPRETLEDEFSKYGEVVDVYNTGKGFAFVTFADERNASEAIRGMNGQVIDGQEIKVDVASSKEIAVDEVEVVVEEEEEVDIVEEIGDSLSVELMKIVLMKLWNKNLPNTEK